MKKIEFVDFVKKKYIYINIYKFQAIRESLGDQCKAIRESRSRHWPPKEK